jgi:aldehyde dehydrogenase (NAD+)
MCVCRARFSGAGAGKLRRGIGKNVMADNSEVSKQELDRVFALQSRQQWVTKKSTATERIARLERLKANIKKSEQDIYRVLHADLGKSAQAVQGELFTTYADIDDAIDNVAAWMPPVQVAPSAAFAEGKATISYEAKGIVLLFGPWNFPFNLIFQPLVPIVAAGNCALVKPNEMSPQTSRLCASIIRETFDEKEVAVFEGGVELANRLLQLRVNHVFFTGSPAVGKIVMAAAAQHLASVTLELGGKNPVVIDRTADIAKAAAKVAMYRNMNSGQLCLCPETVWVPREGREEFISVATATFKSQFYRDGELDCDATGKIIDERNLARVKGYIDDARDKGATVLCGTACMASGNYLTKDRFSFQSNWLL